MRVLILALILAAVAAPGVAAGGDGYGFDFGSSLRSAFFSTFLIALLIGGAVVLLVNMSKGPPEKQAPKKEEWKEVASAPKKAGRKRR